MKKDPFEPTEDEDASREWKDGGWAPTRDDPDPVAAPGCWRLLAVGILLALCAGCAQANPLPWNPFGVTMRSDNTMSVRGAVTDLRMEDPVGGCTFILHHSDSLDGVQVVLDATRGRDCKVLQRKLATILDPAMARLVVKAKGRVVVDANGDGISEEGRQALGSLLAEIDCTATRGANPSLALDPLQRVKQQLDAAAKRIPDGELLLAKARAEIAVAQDDLEQAAALTGPGGVCNVTGLAEAKKALAAMPAATRQTLHATGVQVTKD